MRVFVYYNLHKNLWSIKSLDSGRVIGHKDIIILGGVAPKISEAGRLRVLKEKQKNVHAGLTGTLKPLKIYNNFEESILNCKQITYNPYKYNTFVYKDNDNISFEGCQEAVLINKRVYEIPTGFWT